MLGKRHNFKLFNIITVLFIAAMLLSACAGFSFQAQSAPADDGGITVSGGVDPSAPTDSSGVGTVTPTTVILLLAAFGVLVLILLLLVRGRSSGEKPS